MSTNKHLKLVGDIIINTNKIIAKGQNYISYLAKMKNEPKKYLEAQIISLDKILNNSNTLNLVKKHLKLIQNLNHTNLQNFHSALQTQNHLYIFYEYCEQRLSDVIQKSVNNPITENKIIQIFKQLCQAYNDACVSNKIVHRNLKPGNILFNKNGEIKISNLQVARQIVETDYYDEKILNSKVGSYGYMAPEIADGIGYSNKCDIWSLGIILYEMTFQQLPFNSENNISQCNSIYFPRRISNSLKQLITKMLNVDPLQRITWEALLSDPLLTSNEVDTLQQSQL